ncbi:hypothetical protein [Peribacillus sp. SCS-155]|uniref:hypothetical protein n=1 Tax=Peribacillus sedimenti TaxID=3115297 RepID=UPI0039058CAB
MAKQEDNLPETIESSIWITNPNPVEAGENLDNAQEENPGKQEVNIKEYTDQIVQAAKQRSNKNQ